MQATQLNQQALFKRLDLSPNRLNLISQGRLGSLQIALNRLNLTPQGRLGFLQIATNRLNLAPQGRLGLLQIAAQNLQLKTPMSKNKCSFLVLSLLTPRFSLRQVGQIALSLERVNQGFGFYRGIERRGGG